MRRVLLVILVTTTCALGFAEDWTTFGWDVERSSAPSVAMGVTAANVGSLLRRQVMIDGTVDAAAIYLGGVAAAGGTHDTFFVTTTYGKTLAIDADSGAVLWEFTPAAYGSLKGGYRITNATPVADSNRRFIYAAAPDGVIRKLSVSDGTVVWATAITQLPAREKIASPLSFFGGRVIAATDGYIGDEPPYQGHVAVLDAATGALLAVWNSLGSDRHYLMAPASYAWSDSGIWGRAGVVIDSSTGSLYLATGNGNWNGVTDWGDSVIQLSSDASRIVGNYTPTNTQQLDRDDADLGSTSPALLGDGLIAQGGKDGLIRLLEWNGMSGDAPHRGGETFQTSTPSGRQLFTAPAVFHDAGATWILAADNGGTSAWRVSAGRLVPIWRANHGGTSPIVVDGLTFVYDPSGGLRVYEAETGHQVALLDCGSGHWNSPIMADGRIALPEGNANQHLTSGVLDIWRLAPGAR